MEAALESFRPADEDGRLVHARLQARRGARGSRGPRLPTKPWMSCADALTLGGADRLDERIALANDLAVLADAAGDAASAVVAAHESAMAATLAGDDETAQACLRVIEEAAAKTDDRVAAALVAEHEAAKAAMTGHFDDAVVAVEAAVRPKPHRWAGGRGGRGPAAPCGAGMDAGRSGGSARRPRSLRRADAAADAALEHLVAAMPTAPGSSPAIWPPASGHCPPETSCPTRSVSWRSSPPTCATLHWSTRSVPCWRRTPT